MTSVPLGRGAYRRLYTGAPEVQLLNRWLEANPSNPREGVSTISRPGITSIVNVSPGPVRGVYYLPGIFGDSVWVVANTTLYYIDQSLHANVVIPSTVPLGGTGTPEVAWQFGSGYQRMWIADGGFLHYTEGPGYASGTITRSGTITSNVNEVQIGTQYYKWVSVITGGAGTFGNPWQLLYPGPLSPLDSLYQAINRLSPGSGNYSPGITTPNTEVTMDPPTGSGTSAVIRSKVIGNNGNFITTIVLAGPNISFSGSSLSGGAATMVDVAMPDSVQANSLTQVAGYVLISVKNSQRFYWINPGETTIDPLNFASKESGADPILSMRTVGDQVLVMGSKTTENWYPTGDSNSPFAPQQGRVYARGIISDTPVIVNDGVILVGDDGRVYNVGFQSGDSSDGGWGVSRISDNGIEERIRRQIRREAGLTP